MKTIPLTQGKFAIVDDEDYEWLSKYKWHALKSQNTYYAIRTTGQCCGGKKETIWMHRQILGLRFGDGRLSDHVNHNGLDNRRAKLRIVTKSENQFNRLGTKGYWWQKQSQKFRVQITIRRKHIYLGLFDTAEEAHSAYLAAKRKYHKIAF